MSRIGDLLAELCPAGVIHRQLGDVAGYSSTRVDSTELDSTTFVGVDNLLPSKGGRSDASYLPNTARLTAYEPGDVLLGNIRPYLKKVWLATNCGGCSGDVLALRISPACRSAIAPEFLYYLLSSDSFFAYNMQHAKGAKMPRGNKEAILKYRIPVPPLKVQQEVVRVLDQFTALEAALEAELEARRLQYEHYRHVLLQFTADLPLVQVSDLVRSISSGRNKSRVESGPYPVFGSTGRIGSTDRAAYTEDALLVARVGANAGRVNAVGGEYDVSDNTLVVIPNENWDLRFSLHQLTHMDLNQYAVGGGQPLITGRLLKNLKVYRPPLAEQKRIASTLDKFDALVNDLDVGLPAELARRRQQYEYYRDRLLEFPELVA
jgi:type I restriction enzyme, S subunit